MGAGGINYTLLSFNNPHPKSIVHQVLLLPPNNQHPEREVSDYIFIAGFCRCANVALRRVLTKL